jgi:hypothetical protein
VRTTQRTKIFFSSVLCFFYFDFHWITKKIKIRGCSGIVHLIFTHQKLKIYKWGKEKWKTFKDAFFPFQSNETNEGDVITFLRLTDAGNIKILLSHFDRIFKSNTTLLQISFWHNFEHNSFFENFIEYKYHPPASGLIPPIPIFFNVLSTFTALNWEAEAFERKNTTSG